MDKVTVDGREISFRFQRSPNPNAPVILFVHGFPLDHSMWNEMDSLLDSCSLLSPDLPGFGNSASVGGDWSVADFADALAGLLDELSIEAVIYCGLSMGGYIGWEFERRHAGRLTHLIACNTKAAGDDEMTKRARGFSATAVLANGVDQACDTMLPKLFAAASRENQAQRVEQIVQVMKSCRAPSFAAGQRMMANRHDHDDRLAMIQVPTLVVSGEHDVITPPDMMSEMAGKISGARFHEIPSAGHLAPVERPQEFVSIVRNFIGHPDASK